MADSTFSEGRRAAIERRRALSQGKAGLPPSRERTKTSASVAPAPASTVPAAVTAPTPEPRQVSTPSNAVGFASELTGRIMSMLRRRQQSQGKSALKTGAATAALVSPTASAVASAPVQSSTDGADLIMPTRAATGHELARRLRAERVAARAGGEPRPTRKGRLEYAPKVVVDTTVAGVKVSGLKYTDSARVTGADDGLGKPVSGTQYISPRDASMRAPAVKVGASTTPAGLVVTGTQVRNRVAITGDEAGDHVRITGNAEGSIEADLTPREQGGYDGVAQFSRQANPHGHSVFGTNLGRSLVVAGSRSRDRLQALEVTQKGLTISGSAVGRSSRVTGDEPGSCRVITGDQYLAPAQRQAECGGQGGGTASPKSQDAEARRDPVTGSKVTVSSTWGSARITGASVEHDPQVTGDEPGQCRVITGTPYQGPSTMYGWCSDAAAGEAEARLTQAQAKSVVTGDVPLHDAGVTGLTRGVERDITGTPYYREEASLAAVADPIATQQDRFSVRSPQREAHLKNRIDPLAAPSAEGRITGTFSRGHGKITGNVEFRFSPRKAEGSEAKPVRISGEGSTLKAKVTGDAWAADSRVTGTEGYIAAERNPSERAGKAQAFAGSRLFKAKAQHEEPRQNVTGMVGWSAKSAAKVTLSGGAQG